MNIPSSIEKLKQLLHYEHEEGNLYWLPREVTCNALIRWNKTFAGKRAGCHHPKGYIVVAHEGKSYPAHRICWALYYDEWPSSPLDHINCNRTDNRIVNLRLASTAQNVRNRSHPKNNTSGYKGVRYIKSSNRWSASIGFNSKLRHIGVFSTPHEAARAYDKAAIKFFGEFARTNEMLSLLNGDLK